MGFCLFSNVAIAARYAQKQYGYKRIAIYDFDVHHGNGTHDAFFEEPDVLFISTHQLGSFPNTGSLKETGKGAGAGASINLPLPQGAGHAAAVETFEKIVAPAVRRFQPDLILVSAGYDAHWQDPLASLSFMTSTYSYLSRQVKELANELCSGRCLFILEGGYNLKALGDSVADSFLGVLEQPSIGKEELPIWQKQEPSLEKLIKEARSLHSL